MMPLRHPPTGLGIFVLALGLASCGPSKTTFPVGNDNAKHSKDPYATVVEARGSVFDEGGIAAAFHPGRLFGDDDDEAETGDPNVAVLPESTIRVNGYIWAAALDAIAFMPLEHADPMSGIIQSGWFIDPDFIEERFRVNVFVLSGELREDAVAVGLFYERQDDAGNWVPVRTEEGVAENLEAVIIKGAHELRAAERGSPSNRTRSSSEDRLGDHIVEGALPAPAEHPPYDCGLTRPGAGFC